MRSLQLMMWRRVAVFGVILCSALASSAWAQGRGGGGPKYEPVPREVLDEVTIAAKQTPQYQWYSALPAERMEGLVAKWQEEFGLRLSPQWRALWELIWWNRPIELPGGGTAQLRFANVDGRNALTLETTRYQMGGGAGTPQPIYHTYLIRAADLGDLDRQVLVGIKVQDPLSAPVERFAAQSEPLSMLFNRLCTMGQASCSYRQDLADKMRITLDLRGKTVLGCLTVLARTAGGQATVLGGDREPTSVEKVGLDQSVSMMEDLWRGQAEASTTQPASSQPDLVEILRKSVQSRVESMRKDRPVIILQLPAASE